MTVATRAPVSMSSPPAFHESSASATLAGKEKLALGVS